MNLSNIFTILQLSKLQKLIQCAYPVVTPVVHEPCISKRNCPHSTLKSLSSNEIKT